MFSSWSATPDVPAVPAEDVVAAAAAAAAESTADTAATTTSTLWSRVMGSTLTTTTTESSATATTTTTTASAAAASTTAAAETVQQQQALTDTAAAAATAAAGSSNAVPAAAAVAAKSWFREIVDAVLLIALLHLANLGFQHWNERRLRKQHHRSKQQQSKQASTAASVTTHTSTSSSLMKGGRFSGRFASSITSKLKKKKNARFQLATRFTSSSSPKEEEEDITSTMRTSNLTANNNNNDEGSASESTHNSSSRLYGRYGTQQQNPQQSRSSSEHSRLSSMGRTWSIPQGEGNLPVVLNFATSSVEECLDQMDLLEVQNERELVDILVKCCSQERVYFENYGAVAAHLCHNSMKTTPRHSNTATSRHRVLSPGFIQPRVHRSKWRQALESKFVACYRKETKKLRKLRNAAMFFSHLLTTNAISYQIFDTCKLSNKTTTTSSRYFLKILLKDLAHHLTLPRLQRRIQEFPHAFAGLVLLNRPAPVANSNESVGDKSRRASFTSTTSTLTSYTSNSFLQSSENMRFAVQFLTEIGLKVLTLDMRGHLARIEKEQREQRQRQRKNALTKLKASGGGGSQRSLYSYSSRQYDDDEDNGNISNHSVVTDEASSTASSINSTSIHSHSGHDRGNASQHSVISQLSTSSRTKSASFREMAMNAMNTPPNLKNSFNSLTNLSAAADDHSFGSRESVGNKSSTSNTATAKNKVRSSHRKLSRRIVPHTANLAARKVAAPQTPQHYKRQLFGPMKKSRRVSKSLSPIPSSRAVKPRLPNAPNLDVGGGGDAESSTSSSDSAILPKPRYGAVGMDADGGGEAVVEYHAEYNDVNQNNNNNNNDISDPDLKDDIEDHCYDIYYGDYNLGPAAAAGNTNRKGKRQKEAFAENKEASMDTFQSLPTEDDDEIDNDEDHNDIRDDFQVTGRRNVLFRKRPSIINEEI
mmetsp:Transcript_25240/g.62170  ORF Transcript_25240/g.62170 Transcript_25240/m.62170 type:complete len:933 (+) Transcript_25240:189-2987(+)